MLRTLVLSFVREVVLRAAPFYMQMTVDEVIARGDLDGAGDKNAFHATARPGLRGTYPSPLADNPWKSASPGGPRFLGPCEGPRDS
jgi:hypothetical protein